MVQTIFLALLIILFFSFALLFAKHKEPEDYLENNENPKRSEKHGCSSCSQICNK